MCIFYNKSINMISSVLIKMAYIGILTQSFVMGDENAGKANAQNHNIVFIIVDDLRPALGCYGDTKAFTPNIDRFAEHSFVFQHAYAQQALCAPSRNSMLTSRRPDTLHLYDFYSYWRDFAGNFTTFPQYLKTHGYKTYSMGKVFHPGKSSNFTDDFPYSWTQPTYHPSTECYMNDPICPEKNSVRLHRNLICPVEVRTQPGNTLPDMETVDEAKKFLKQINETKTPIFLAVGLHKPHIPFRFPHRFLQYHHNVDKFVEPPFDRTPFNLPSVAFNPFTDLRDRHDVKRQNVSFPYGPMPHELGLHIRQAYYTSVTYMDDLVGQLLAHVNLSNTIVILTGDHGWQLGEHAEWAKYSNYDVSLRVPLIIYSPDYVLHTKRKVNALVELVDLFPTIVDLAKLPSVPVCSNPHRELTCTQGKSIVPLMGNVAIDVNTPAFSQYPRPGIYPSISPNSDRPRLRQIRIMGYTIRTLRYRYTLWVQFNRQHFRKVWQVVYGEELYDHLLDSAENINLFNDEKYTVIKLQLKRMLQRKNSVQSTIKRIKLNDRNVDTNSRNVGSRSI